MERQNSTKRAARILVSAATFAATMFIAAARPASAQTTCQPTDENTYPPVCGYVWDDLDKDGIRDSNEPPLVGVEVDLYINGDTDLDPIQAYTDQNGYYSVAVLDNGPYAIYVKIAQDSDATTANVNSNMNDDFDSDGVPDGYGNSLVTGVEVLAGSSVSTDFGFFEKSVQGPGTGTPGYWKNHASAWPVSSITIGGETYTKEDAISWLGKVGKDKTTTIFASLVSAELNVLVGNDASCVESTIAAADVWMALHPVGSNVAGSSAAWAEAEPLHKLMDAYNNGLLCAPHRN